MIDVKLRNGAIEALNLMDGTCVDVEEKTILNACWWLLYSVGFDSGRSRIDHLKYAKKMIDRVLDKYEK